MKRKQRTSVVFMAVIFCFAVYAVLTLIRLQIQIQDKKDKLNELTEQLETVTIANEELKEQIEAGVSDEYIESLARENGYAQPGERVFVDTSSK